MTNATNNIAHSLITPAQNRQLELTLGAVARGLRRALRQHQLADTGKLPDLDPAAAWAKVEHARDLFESVLQAIGGFARDLATPAPAPLDAATASETDDTTPPAPVPAPRPQPDSAPQETELPPPPSEEDTGKLLPTPLPTSRSEIQRLYTQLRRTPTNGDPTFARQKQRALEKLMCCQRTTTHPGAPG